MPLRAGYTCTRAPKRGAEARAGAARRVVAARGCRGSRHAASPKLPVGVGRADITPIMGGYKGGWSCTCAKVIGQQGRLYARVIVLKVGGQKVAPVTEDLFALSAGMVRDAALRHGNTNPTAITVR